MGIKRYTPANPNPDPYPSPNPNANPNQVPICSYWSSSPSLSDGFPYFGRTYPSDVIATPALLKTIKALGWTNVAVIYTNNAYGIDYAEGLSSNAPSLGVNVHARFDFEENDADSIRVAVKKLSESGTNIFVAISSGDADLSTIFYEAESQGIVGERFAWLTTDSVTGARQSYGLRARQLMNGTINVRHHVPRTVSSRESAWGLG